MASLFADSTKKVEKAPIVHQKTAEELETDNLVAHQKEMLEQQKAAANDDQDLGEGAKGEMKNLFADSTKKVEKAPVVHVKTAEELETENLVAHQKEMLEQQKAAANDNQDLGEGAKGEMTNLFGDSTKKVEKAPAPAAQEPELPTWMSKQERAEMLEARRQQEGLLRHMGVKAAEEKAAEPSTPQAIQNAFAARFGLPT